MYYHQQNTSVILSHLDVNIYVSNVNCVSPCIGKFNTKHKQDMWIIWLTDTRSLYCHMGHHTSAPSHRIFVSILQGWIDTRAVCR